jgi:metallo-beta-lactamase family protein
MCEAGRIKHHLKHHLWDPKCSVVFVGYQAEGTLGRSIVNGDKDVTIFGEKIHINAEIYNLEGFSGHADRDGLLEWLSGFKRPPKRIFLVHGEESSKKGFAHTVKQTLGYDCTVVEDVSEYNLESDLLCTVYGTRNRVATQEQLTELKDQLARIHDDLEAILYNTNLAVDSSTTQEQIDEITNLILELDKSSSSLVLP